MTNAAYDYFHPVYLAARAEALLRDKGICVFCGESDAKETHHRALKYPPENETTADDLVSLCRVCHEAVTNYRRFRRYGGDKWLWASAAAGLTEELLKQCSTRSTLEALGQSSCVTEQPGSMSGPLPSSRWQKSPVEQVQTERPPTTPGSRNSSAKPAFGSTRVERLRSRLAHSGRASKRAHESSNKGPK